MFSRKEVRMETGGWTGGKRSGIDPIPPQGKVWDF
jgi:hypothetical protein